MRSLLVLAASVGLALCACPSTAPQATTVNGVVEGFCLVDSPVQVNAFYGVPFAEPPARFAKPLPKNNWSGVLPTKTQPNMCIQVTGSVSSEDCLYLNVFTPANASNLPVFAVVHGGAFSGGSAQEGIPEHIANNLVAKGIVVVAIQYRVGPLGFCTTKDSEMPGNYGMWDAKMAFEWIRDNIAAFGGNPNDVTAYGGSAGGSLIDGMHLSPLTTNLFHKMALFSAVAYDMWESDVKENCEARATSLNLTWTDSASYKSALLSTPVDGLRGGWMTINEIDMIFLEWGPVLDGDFFPTTPAAMRAATQPKPTIWGVPFLEGAALIGSISPLDHNTLDLIVELMVPPAIANRSMFQSYFLESYRNQGVILEPTAADKHAAMAAFGEQSVMASMDAVLRRNFELFGANQTAYRYVFKHFNPAPLGPAYPFISFASHSFDQWFSIGIPGLAYTPADQLVIDLYTQALVNFAKTGNPNGSGATALPVEWVASTAENPSLNYVIETTPYMSPQFFYGRPHLKNILAKEAGTFKPC